MARRLLSVLIAVVATVLGYLAAWTGGVATAMSANAFRGGFDPSGLPLVLLGLVLLAVAGLTIVMSSAGVIVVGAAHVLFGLLAFALPVTGITGGFSPAYGLIRLLFSVSPSFADGLYFSVPTGFGMLVGVALLVSGLMARSRQAPTNSIARVTTGLVALVLGVPGVLLVLTGGGSSYRRTAAMLQPATPLDVVLIASGVILVAVVVASVRWSSTGVILLGAIVSVLGVVFLVASAQIFGTIVGISQEFAAGVQSAGATGNVLILGVVLLAVGFGVRVRARRSVTLAPADVPDVASV